MKGFTNNLREILTNSANKLFSFWRNTGGKENTKQNIGITVTQLKLEINKHIPKDRCHIILATAKRFKCKTCSIKAWCKFKVYNQIAGDLRKRLEIKND